MTTILLFVAVAAILIWQKMYSGDNHRLLPASTPKGKQGRIVGAIILLIGLMILILNIAGESSGHEKLVGVEEALLGVAVAIVAALSRTGKKSKKR